MKFAVRLCILCGVVASVNGAGTPVEKVVNLLKDLEEKLTNDEKVEQKMYDKYACWCEKTTERKAGHISQAQDDLRGHGQSILSLKGGVATLTSEIDELAADIQKNEEDMAEATTIRQKENTDFMAATTEMKEVLAALERAIGVLVKGSNQSALLQSSTQARSAVQAVVEVLPSSNRVKPEHLSFLSEFLSGRSGSKYMPQSFTVQGILTDMYETFAKDLEGAMQDEASKNRNFEKFIATKTQENKEYGEVKGIKEDKKASSELELSDTQVMYDDTSAQKKADIEFFDETKKACSAKHEEWSTRSSLRDEEVSGIREALKILTSDDARELFASAIKEGKEVGADDKYDTGRDIALSFLQVQGEQADPALQAFGALKRGARGAHSLRLAALAVQAREAKKGHFDKVLHAIQEMQETLKKEDLADIAKRDQCKEEYTKSESAQKDLEWRVEKHIAKIEKLVALIEKRTAEKMKTIEDLEAARKLQIELIDTREEEKIAFEKAKMEDQQAIDLLMSAREAMTKFYKKHKVDMGPIQGSVKGAAFDQEEPVFDVDADDAPDAVFSDKGKRKHESKGIVQIMTMIIEDLDDEIKNAMKAEEAAIADFKAQMKAVKQLMDELQKKINSLTAAIAKREQEKYEEKNDKADTEAALQEEQDYKKSITPDCDWIIGAFEKRAAARKAEADGLTKAKEFLVGYQPPAEGEAALLERQKASAFDDTALARARFLSLRR